MKVFVLAGFPALVLAACEAGREPGVIAPVEGFAGMVAGDEPRAVTVGRDVLGNGGSAADAAVAMYFTMTATMPSRVGIAGGGLCLAHSSGLAHSDREPGVEVIEFLPDPADPGRLQMGGPRAMAVLHARHGLLRWEVLLSDAERLTRSGHSVSRAFARDIADAAAFVSADPELRLALSNKAGELAGEGDQIVLSGLSSLISGLRRQGAGYLYGGAFATRFVEAAQAAGYRITSDDLRQMVPQVTEPLAIPFGDNFAYFPPNDGGLLSAQMWGMLSEVASYRGASETGKAHLLAEAGQRAFAQRSTWLWRGDRSVEPLVSEDHLKLLLAGYSDRQHNKAAVAEGTTPGPVSNPFTAGFVVADSWSNAVACSFSINGLFGAGRMIPGTGILVPREATPGANSLSAAIISNPLNGTVYFAATATGGLAAPAALTRVMLEGGGPEGSVAEAIAAPRLVNVADPDITFYEPSLDPSVLAALRQRGHDLQPEPGVGRANAFNCPAGLRFDNRTCVSGTDGRGFGLSVRAQ